VNISPIHLKVVPYAVAVLLGSLATGAFATPALTSGPITLDANYSLAGGAPPVDGMTDPSSNLYNPGNGADFYLFKSDALGNNVFFHTYGFASSPTYFGARASGEGHFAADTRATFSKSFTNNSSVAQLYNFSFMVDAGEVGIGGTGEGFASLLLNIKKDGSTVAQDFTSITQTALGAVTCADNDTGLAYMSCLNGTVGNAFGSGGPFNVSMGLIGAGETFTLDYDIIATVSGNLTSSSGNYYQACYGGGDGHGGDAVVPDKEICTFNQFFPGSAIARSGDPFNGPLFGNQAASADINNPFAQANFQVAPASVPEPGSMALIGLGLAGLAIARRKKAINAVKAQ